MIRATRIPLVAVALAVLYGLLSTTAIACQSAHAEGSAYPDHRTNAAAHSAFCAVACGAVQAVALTAAAPDVAHLALVGLCLVPRVGLSALVSQGSRPARAPPR